MADWDTGYDPASDDEESSQQLWSLEYATPSVTPPNNTGETLLKFGIGLVGGLGASTVVYYKVWRDGPTGEHILLAGSLVFIVKLWLIVAIATTRAAQRPIAHGLLWSMITVGAAIGGWAIHHLYIA